MQYSQRADAHSRGAPESPLAGLLRSPLGFGVRGLNNLSHSERLTGTLFTLLVDVHHLLGHRRTDDSTELSVLGLRSRDGPVSVVIPQRRCRVGTRTPS
jgi:hypothetical protein